LVRRGAIGELRFVHVPFTYFNDDATNICNVAELGGGALYDIRCYAVVTGLFERRANAAPGRFRDR